MKYLALALILLGVYLVKRGFGTRVSFESGAFLGAILIGCLGLLCIAAGVIVFLVLVFLAL